MALGHYGQGAQLQSACGRCGDLYCVLWVNQIQEVPLIVHQAVTLTRGSCSLLSGAVGRGLVVLGLIVLPATELVLPLNLNCCPHLRDKYLSEDELSGEWRLLAADGIDISGQAYKARLKAPSSDREVICWRSCLSMYSVLTRMPSSPEGFRVMRQRRRRRTPSGSPRG